MGNDNGKKETLIQSLKYTLLSFSAGAVEFLSFLALDHLKFSYSFAHVTSVVLSVIWNFTLNRKYTFKSANNIPIAMLKAGLFYVFFIPITAYLGQIASSNGINDFIIKTLTMASNFILEFIWWKLVVFKGTENTNDIAGRSK